MDAVHLIYEATRYSASNSTIDILKLVYLGSCVTLEEKDLSSRKEESSSGLKSKKTKGALTLQSLYPENLVGL